MTDHWLDELTGAYVAALAASGIELRRETAAAMIAERVRRLAAGLGVDEAAARAWYDVEVVRGWAREAVAELREEQPEGRAAGEPTLALAPVAMIALCIEACLAGEPQLALAGAAAAALRRYPAILMGGIGMVRCDVALLERLAQELAGRDRVLARHCTQLVQAANRGGGGSSG